MGMFLRNLRLEELIVEFVLIIDELVDGNKDNGR
jgi:hypothetical protein